MTCWTNDKENLFLRNELPAFKALRENSANRRYGKIKVFINGLYTRFVAKFPLKNNETPESKQKVRSFVSTS